MISVVLIGFFRILAGFWEFEEDFKGFFRIYWWDSCDFSRFDRILNGF